jgi:hypothetical protein
LLLIIIIAAAAAAAAAAANLSCIEGSIFFGMKLGVRISF